MNPSLQFVEREPHEAGFAAVFDEAIAPKLEALEDKRKRNFGIFLKRMGFVLGVAAAAMGAALALPGHWTERLEYLIVIPILALVVGGIWCQKLFRGHEANMREAVIEPICHFIGDLENDPEAHVFSHRPFARAGVIGRYDRAEVEDVFTGWHRQTNFKMAEGKFVKGQGRNARTIFRGLLMEIEVPEPFEGRVAVVRRGHVWDWIRRKLFPAGDLKELERVLLPGNGAFARRYLVRSDNAETARRLLTPHIRSVLVRLDRTFPPGFWRNLFLAGRRKTPQAAFRDGIFLLALPMNRDLFGTGTLWRSVYGCTRDIRGFLKDVMIAHYVIDLLHEPRASRT